SGRSSRRLRGHLRPWVRRACARVGSSPSADRHDYRLCGGPETPSQDRRQLGGRQRGGPRATGRADRGRPSGDSDRQGLPPRGRTGGLPRARTTPHAREDRAGALKRKHREGSRPCLHFSHKRYNKVAFRLFYTTYPLTESEMSTRAGSNVLVRYLPDGSLDTTFGVNGISETNFGYVYNASADIRIQSDGKIVVASTTRRADAGAQSAVTARYLADSGMASTPLGAMPPSPLSP